MGFFSWKTQDTNKSISNTHSSKGALKVVLLDNDNNIWIEKDYEGYGEFNRQDFYKLLAKMNGKETREEGINLFFGVRAIESIKTGKIFKGQGIDFFNWQDEKLTGGKSASELLESGEFKRILIKEEGIIYPNLIELKSLKGWEWRNEAPKDCENQGYFY